LKSYVPSGGGAGYLTVFHHHHHHHHHHQGLAKESDRCTTGTFIPSAKEIRLDCSEPVVEPALKGGSALLVEANRVCIVDTKPIPCQISYLRGIYFGF
jgi:hypothetical protein